MAEKQKPEDVRKAGIVFFFGNTIVYKVEERRDDVTNLWQHPARTSQECRFHPMRKETCELTIRRSFDRTLPNSGPSPAREATLDGTIWQSLIGNVWKTGFALHKT